MPQLYDLLTPMAIDYRFIDQLASTSVSYDYAIEGALSDIVQSIFPSSKSKKASAPTSEYKVIIDQNGNNEIFSKAPHTEFFYLDKNNVIIDNDRKIIVIRNINYELLFKRIKETYGEKRLDAIFYRTYGSKDIKKFKKKKTTRSKMKVTSLISPIFFALELSILFSQLYKKYHDKSYKTIARDIYEKSWLKDSDNRVPESVDIRYAQSLLSTRYQLKPYQIEFIEAYPKWKAKLNLRGIYNSFDQGLGKTLTALSLAMAKKIDKVYVICPNTLVSNWYNEVNSYYDGKIKPFICTSTSKPNTDSQVYIVNNESIKNIYKYIDTSCKTMLIIDEGHNFRTLGSSRVKELIDFCEKLNPEDVLPMSGTPLKASPNELVPALLLIDPAFTMDAAIMYNRCFKFDDYQAMEIVTARLGKVIYRKMKNDVLQLPNKYINDMYVNIKDPSKYLLTNIREEVMEHYKLIFPTVISNNVEILTSFKELVNKYSTAGALETKWYLSKICSAADPETEDSIENMHELDSEKVTEFLDNYILINPNISASDAKLLKLYEAKLIHFDQVAKGRAVGKVYPVRRTEMYNLMWDENEDQFVDMINSNIKKTIIFSQFYGVITHIQERLAENGIKSVSISGKVNTKQRADNLRAFKEDPDIRVIIATSQSMGTGVTLNEASQLFFFGPPWRSADFDQCCDRLYRLGQDCDVYIYNVILETRALNLSSKMDKILKWSGEMFHNAIDGTVVNDE